MCRFLIKGSFVFKAKNKFVIAGEIMEGTIKIGMSYSMNPKYIISVEGIDYNGGKSRIGLMFHYNTEYDLENYYQIFQTDTVATFL